MNIKGCSSSTVDGKNEDWSIWFCVMQQQDLSDIVECEVAHRPIKPQPSGTRGLFSPT